jgi:transcription termination factor Rho
LPFGTIRDPSARDEAPRSRSGEHPRSPPEPHRASQEPGASRGNGAAPQTQRGEGAPPGGGGGRRGRRRRGRRGRGDRGDRSERPDAQARHERGDRGDRGPRVATRGEERRPDGEDGPPQADLGANAGDDAGAFSDDFSDAGGNDTDTALEPRDARRDDRARHAPQVGSGMFVLDKSGFGVLRSAEHAWRPSKEDIFVPKHLILREKLRDGSIVEGRITRGQKHKYQLQDISTVDGRKPAEVRNLTPFKALTSIDPDFHYAIGDGTDEVSMRIVDVLCPVGRGQRGLIVAPPRTGKTTILRQFAHGIETIYPDVHLMVVLVDERPEEATEWKRSVVRGQVFVSTADETAKNHIQTAEIAWMRAMRLVELGQDVIILLDSITRLARAYNNQAGNSGKTMSGGLDSHAMERPRKIFGSARNTESAGSLTILGTTLIETGSRLDQLVFEEFKGTGNMELVLSRRLADRRIFPALDIERSGTRKEEKLVGLKRLKRIHTLRRVLSRMNYVEAMELLITKLDEVEKTDDFLARFEIDPEKA